MIHFYSRSCVHRCSCGKEAHVEIMGTGNVSYGYACKRCEKKRLAHLERVHNSPPSGKAPAAPISHDCLTTTGGAA